MDRIAWAIALLLVILSAAPITAQGRLQEARDGARTSSPPTPSSSPSPSSSSQEDSVINDIVNGLFSSTDTEAGVGLLVIGAAVLSPFYVPAMLFNDTYSYRLYFASHPYPQGYRGYQLLGQDFADMFYDEPTNLIRRKSWSIRVLAEDGNDFNGLNRLGTHFKLEHASRWGVTSSWNLYQERLPRSFTDEILIGDTNLTFRFAQNEIASMYTGLGFRMLNDRRQTDFGFNFTYGGDWFPVRPFVVSGVFDAGTVGAIWLGGEVFLGYDFLRIGGVNLQGPLAGVRLWF